MNKQEQKILDDAKTRIKECDTWIHFWNNERFKAIDDACKVIQNLPENKEFFQKIKKEHND